jgi:hypothetical protein
MRLRELLEGRKKTDRHQVRQQLNFVHRSDTPTQFRPGVPWARIVSQHFYDLQTPQDQRRRVMRSLQALEHAKGKDFMQSLPGADYKIIIKELIAKFDAQASLPVAHMRPGVSGVYNLDTAPRVHIDAAKTARMNMVDMDVPNLTKDELHGHEQEDVRKIGRALSDQKDYHLQDKAMVFDLHGRPWYLFIRPYKRFPGSETSVEGKTEFVAYIPQGMNFRSKGISDSDMNIFHKGQKFEPLMRSTEGRVALGTYVGTDFQEAVHALQSKAWAASKEWFGGYRLWQETLLQIEILEKKQRAQNGLNHEDSGKLHVLKYREKVYHAVLTGKPLPDKFPDPTLDAALRSMSKDAKKAFTWYAWLLVAEDEYGIRLPERHSLYPAYPTTPRKTKGKQHEWAIQPKRKEAGKFRWDTTVFKGLGYTQHDWTEFIDELRASSYKLKKSDDEVERLWLPLVGSIRQRHGLGLHPQDISDYLASAHSSGKVLAQAEKIAGRTSHKLNIRKTLNAPMYIFKGGNQGREFALIPAAAYLQYFDSPYHGGERLIHGRFDFEPPKGSNFSAQRFSAHPTRWSQKTGQMAQAWHDKKAALGYAPKNKEFSLNHQLLNYRRARADLRVADNIVKLRNEKFRKEKERLKRRSMRDKPTQRASSMPLRPSQTRPGHNVLVHHRVGAWKPIDPSRPDRRQYVVTDMGTKIPDRQDKTKSYTFPTEKVRPQRGATEFHPIPVRVNLNSLGPTFSAGTMPKWSETKQHLQADARRSGMLIAAEKFNVKTRSKKKLRR